MASRLALREVLGLEVGLLADLPIATTLVARSAAGALVHFTTSRPMADDLVSRGAVVLTPREFELVAVGLSDGRLHPKTAALLLERKAKNPRYRIERRDVLGPVRQHDGRPLSWEELLGELGLELVDLILEVSAAGAQEGAAA